MNDNNKKIAKNTSVLYLRMAFTMFLSFFTSRIVLNALGVDDYGIYNVIGGVTSMFIFLNSTMSVSTSRFIAYEIGTGNKEKVPIVYSQAKIIHYVLAFLILLLIETVGLWMVHYKLTIPPNRIEAAVVVLHTVSLGTFINIISTPDMALVIAYEKMTAFAYISVLDGILRLIVAYLIYVCTLDKLVTYSALMLLIFVFDRVCYWSYCRRNFMETHTKLIFVKDKFKEMLSFAGWNLMGNLANMLKDQGITILINIFTNPAVNAARGITSQVSNAVSAFVTNIRMAVNPQITKSFAEGKTENMHRLIVFSSLSCYFVLLLLALPLYWLTDLILNVWLVEVPEYSSVFLKLTLVSMLVYSFANPVIIGIHATGNIKKFQLVEGVLMLLTLPIAYLFFVFGLGPEWSYIAIIIGDFVAQIGRVVVVMPRIDFPISSYMNNVVWVALKVTFASCFLPFLLYFLITNTHSVIFLLGQSVISVLSVMLAIYYVGLNLQQRQKMVLYVKSKFKR